MTNVAALVIFFACFLGLVVLSNTIRRLILGISTLLSSELSLGVKVYSLLFLPGTLIHELAHFLTAAVLMVPTGTITIFPEEMEDNRVRLGSVRVARTDFFRASIIGLAPIIVGSILLLFIYESYFAAHNIVITNLTALETINWLLLVSQPVTLALLYLTIAIANTMFTSKEDTKYWPAFFIFLIPIIGIIYLSGKLFATSEATIAIASTIGARLSLPFLFAALADCVLIVPLYAIKRLLEILLHKRLTYR